MDKEVVGAIQNFCDIFDREGRQPNKIMIINIPQLVDSHYIVDPIRSDLLKLSYKHQPPKTSVIHFQDLVDDSEPDTDSLYDVSFSTPEGSMRPKLVFPSSDEFSEEETTGDSALN